MAFETKQKRRKHTISGKKIRKKQNFSINMKKKERKREKNLIENSHSCQKLNIIFSLIYHHFLHNLNFVSLYLKAIHHRYKIQIIKLYQRDQVQV